MRDAPSLAQVSKPVPCLVKQTDIFVMDGSNVAVEYMYDKNGNLTKDYNKKIVDIQYNPLNLR